jgi:hypothetical protein
MEPTPTPNEVYYQLFCSTSIVKLNGIISNLGSELLKRVWSH